MLSGVLSGVLWALDTVVIGLALSYVPFVNGVEAMAIAPFVSTFLHDACSSLYLLVCSLVKGSFTGTKRAVRTRSGKFIMLGAMLAGPIGMSSYVMAIKYMGPSYTAIVSSLYPAVGVLFSYLFLKEKMCVRQAIGFLIAIVSIVTLSFTPSNVEVLNLGLGMLCGVICCVGWASEAVIVAYGLKEASIKDEEALQIRQTTSALAYGLVVIPLLQGYGMVNEVMHTSTMAVVALAGLCGTLSYLFYYRSIGKIGAIKSMALNIGYVAWAIVFSFVILKHVPSVMEVVCGLCVIGGSILTVYEKEC